VAQSVNLPAYATSATVFLNGWHLQYLESDHNVAGLATAIGNISLANNVLQWQAAGVLEDDNFDDPYSWCYFFTVVGWDPTKISAVVQDKDGSCDNNDSDANFFSADNVGNSTALSSFSSFLQNPAFASSNTVAILPRGFGFAWSQCNDDHHLLQVGYNQDHSATFIEGGKKYWKRDQEVVAFPKPSPSASPSGALSQADSGSVSWDTYTIFKDNDTKRDYNFGEVVSGVAGNDVGVLEPPFSILPKDGESSGTIAGPAVTTREFVIDSIPFTYAIPMLTGWELRYITDDQHVKEIGVWIDKIHFRDPADPPGRLRYKLSSTLHDDDTDPPFASAHKVTVLGLRPVPPISPIQKTPDLVPFSPAGNSPNAFCRTEQQGKVLRVTVKNQGNENAGVSKTTVAFGSQSFTLDTPPIPAGGSVDLLFKVPANCFKPDCSFKITVDSSNQVNEGPNEGNNSINSGCTG